MLVPSNIEGGFSLEEGDLVEIEFSLDEGDEITHRGTPIMGVVDDRNNDAGGRATVIVSV